MSYYYVPSGTLGRNEGVIRHKKTFTTRFGPNSVNLDRNEGEIRQKTGFYSLGIGKLCGHEGVIS